jgi:hypothetical protein
MKDSIMMPRVFISLGLMGFHPRCRSSRHLPHDSHYGYVGYPNGGVKSHVLWKRYLSLMEQSSERPLEMAFEALECLFWHYVIKRMTF